MDFNTIYGTVSYSVTQPLSYGGNGDSSGSHLGDEDGHVRGYDFTA